MPATTRVHSRSRGPSTSWSRYALASASEVMPYRIAVGLWPSRCSWGNTNQIQWLRLRPLRSSSSTRVVDAILGIDEALKIEWICAIG